MDGSTSLVIAPPLVVLRDYQQDAVTEIRESFKTFDRVCYVLPTGGGKTITFSYVVANAVLKGKTVVIIAHRREIVCQISAALRNMGVDHGIVAPGFRMTTATVQVAMVQTLVKRLGCVPVPDLLVIDECHHAPAGSWLKVMDAYKGCKVLGVTATPIRLDKKGLSVAFDDLVCGPSMKKLIELGALAPYLYFAPPSDVDMSALTTVGGDWEGEEVDRIVMASTAMGDAIVHYKRYLEGKPALCFCTSVVGAEAIAQRFTDNGIPALSLDGDLSTPERARRLAMLESGEVLILTSCMLISEGFDCPAVAGAILLRPTLSLSLFLQQIGRSLRPKPGGGFAIILDHVGNVARHGMPDMDRAWTLDGLKHQANPVSQCESCYIVQETTFVRSRFFECPNGLGERTPGRVLMADMDPADLESLTEKQRAALAKLEADKIPTDEEGRALLAEKMGFERGKDVCPYLDQEIDLGDDPEPCLWNGPGELEEVVDVRPIDHPEWAGGLSLHATGKQFYQLLDRAGTDVARLNQIAATRGYKPGWVKHKLAERYAIDQELVAWEAQILGLADLSEQALWTLHRMLVEADTEVTRAFDRKVRHELFHRKNKAA